MRGEACFKESATQPSLGGGASVPDIFWHPLLTPKRFYLEQPNLVWKHVGQEQATRGHFRGWGPGIPNFLRFLPTSKRFHLEQPNLVQ